MAFRYYYIHTGLTFNSPNMSWPWLFHIHLAMESKFDENSNEISTKFLVSLSVIDAFNFKVIESEQISMLATMSTFTWRKYAITDPSQPGLAQIHLTLTSPTLTIDNTGIYLSAGQSADDDVPLRRHFVESAKCIEFSCFVIWMSLNNQWCPTIRPIMMTSLFHPPPLSSGEPFDARVQTTNCQNKKRSKNTASVIA